MLLLGHRRQNQEEIHHCNINYPINLFHVKGRTEKEQVGKVSSPRATKPLQELSLELYVTGL